MTQRDVERVIERARDLLKDKSHFEILDNSEMNTRYMLIDPMLRALGWDLSHPNQADFERKIKKGKRIKKVDYALLDEDGKIFIVIETKKVDTVDKDWEKGQVQLQKYVQDVRHQGYAVLTNGGRWKIWDLSKGSGFSGNVVAEVDIRGESPMDAARRLFALDRSEGQALRRRRVNTSGPPTLPSTGTEQARDSRGRFVGGKSTGSKGGRKSGGGLPRDSSGRFVSAKNTGSKGGRKSGGGLPRDSSGRFVSAKNTGNRGGRRISGRRR